MWDGANRLGSSQNCENNLPQRDRNFQSAVVNGDNMASNNIYYNLHANSLRGDIMNSLSSEQGLFSTFSNLYSNTQHSNQLSSHVPNTMGSIQHTMVPSQRQPCAVIKPSFTSKSKKTLPKSSESSLAEDECLDNAGGDVDEDDEYAGMSEGKKRYAIYKKQVLAMRKKQKAEAEEREAAEVDATIMASSHGPEATLSAASNAGFKTAKQQILIDVRKHGKVPGSDMLPPPTHHQALTNQDVYNTEGRSYPLTSGNERSFDINENNSSLYGGGGGRKQLGGGCKRNNVFSKFVPPVRDGSGGGMMCGDDPAHQDTSSNIPAELRGDERLKNIENKMIELIMNEIMDHGPQVTWDDIAGLEFAKKTIKEIVVWPMLRPDIFTGLRGPPKGILLFGPPGTGKTMIGKCIASQSKSTFFSISASSLTSKWVGEGEKMVRALFAVARCYQPAVIFMDEIDSLLSQRSSDEHESSRRIKTEFLVQLDGATTSDEDRLLIVGATNRPQEIDEAARRRLVKRLYIPLPDVDARRQILVNLLRRDAGGGVGDAGRGVGDAGGGVGDAGGGVGDAGGGVGDAGGGVGDAGEGVGDTGSEGGVPGLLSDQHLTHICERTAGYSGADMTNLCREAALGPIRDIPAHRIQDITADQVRAINYSDFVSALETVRASVCESDIDVYIKWNNTYGCGKW